jgi:hypothetical protein
MNQSLTFIPRVHLHFPYATVSSTPGFMDDETWKISDETCHELWHYLSSHQGLSRCPLKAKHRRRIDGKIALETLTISVATVEDGFQPINVPVRVAGRTWVITPVNSMESCVTLSCPEIDAAEKHSQEDAGYSSYYQYEIYELKRFGQEVVQPRNSIIQEFHVFMMPMSSVSQRHLLMALQLAVNGGTGAEVILPQTAPHRIPI